LAAVVNGLGIVRYLTDLSEYLRRRQALDFKPYWVFILIAGFQFMLRILWILLVSFIGLYTMNLGTTNA
jgi:hypothetical protein